MSKWTVIRAFTPGAQIAPDTRERVLEAAAALSYQPNLLARSLATKRTNLIGILVDDFANPYKLPTLERLTGALQSNGMLGVLININRDYDHVAAIANARQRQLDAIVLFGTAFHDDTITSADIPIYVLARDSTISSIPSVTCNAERAMEEICAHLEKRGYRRPGFMAGPRTVSTALGRRRRFADFWKKRGLPLAAELDAARYDRHTAAAALRAYLEDTPPTERADVLMCENDILALGALDVARNEFGLAVPDDLAIIGYDDIDFSGMAGFNLTTYRQPYEQMVDTLVDMLMGRRPSQTVRLPGRLVARATG